MRWACAARRFKPYLGVHGGRQHVLLADQLSAELLLRAGTSDPAKQVRPNRGGWVGKAMRSMRSRRCCPKEGGHRVTTKCCQGPPPLTHLEPVLEALQVQGRQRRAGPPRDDGLALQRPQRAQHAQARTQASADAPVRLCQLRLDSPPARSDASLRPTVRSAAAHLEHAGSQRLGKAERRLAQVPATRSIHSRLPT